MFKQPSRAAFTSPTDLAGDSLLQQFGEKTGLFFATIELQLIGTDAVKETGRDTVNETGRDTVDDVNKVKMREELWEYCPS